MWCTGWNSKWLCNQWPKDNSCALFRGQSNFTHFFSNSAAERGQTWGRGASQRCMVTAVRIRQSDCRLSKCDVTYPSAGILLLPFSSGPGRGKKRKENHTEISYEIITQQHHTRETGLLMPVAILTRTHRLGVGSSCDPHVVTERCATWRQHSVALQQCPLGDNLKIYIVLMTDQWIDIYCIILWSVWQYWPKAEHIRWVHQSQEL